MKSLMAVSVCALLLLLTATSNSEERFQSPERVVDEPVDKPYSLVFLRDFQLDDGSWGAKTGHPESRKDAKANGAEVKCESEDGAEEDNTANTSLALLKFLGVGYDHTDGPFQVTCRKAIKFLRRKQTETGLFSDNIVHHCFALKAMSEAYGLSGLALLKPMCDKAVEALQLAQHEDGGFGDNDKSNTIATTWAVLALSTAKICSMEIDAEVRVNAYKYIESLRKNTFVKYSKGEKYPPQVGNKLKKRLPVCEAGWVLAALFSGELKFDDELVTKMTSIFVKKGKLPEWKANNIDMQYCYFTTLAQFQCGGKNWKVWSKALGRQLLDSQRGFSKADKDAERTSSKKTLEYGSWDPAGINAHNYGRVYSTCMAGLCLDIYNRAGRKADPDDKDGPDPEDIKAAKDR